MTVNYTTNLGLGQPVTGTESGTWGDDVNNAITSYLDIAIAGTLSLTSASFTANALTLANTFGTSSATNISSTTTAQHYAIKVSSLAANVTITAPLLSKTYLIINLDSTYSVTIKTAGQSGVAIAAGEKILVYCSGAVGADYIKTGASIPNSNGNSTGTGAVVLAVSPTLTGTPLAPTAATSTNTTQIATTAFVQAVLQLLYPVGSIYTNASNSTNPATLFGFGTWAFFSQGRMMVGYDSGVFSIGATGGAYNSSLPSHTHTASASASSPATSSAISSASSSFSGNALGGHSHTYDTVGISSTSTPGGQYNVPIPVATTGTTSAVSAGTPSGSVSTSVTTSVTTSVSTSVSVSVDAAGVSPSYTNLPPYIVVYMWQRTA